VCSSDLANWQALVAGRSGLRSIDRFPTNGLRSSVAGTLDSLTIPFDDEELVLALDDMDCMERALWLAEAAGREAVRQAGLGTAGRKRGDTAAFPGNLYIACSPSEFEWPQLKRLDAAGDGERGYPRLCRAAATEDVLLAGERERLLFGTIPQQLASPEVFGTEGVPYSVCTACASGATAIGLGLEAIRRGAEAALCIGTDATVHQEAMVRFSLLSAVSTHNEPPQEASRPFDKTRAGFVVGEGAGALVLESYDAAKARGAKILGLVMGYGERQDDFHRTRTNPSGKPMVDAIVNALQDAGVAPQQVDYVNAHGTATGENDKMEALALMSVMGERMKRVPVSSNKGQIGHTLLAAGAVEAAISLLTLQHQVLPPTMNYRESDPAIPLDVVPNAARPGKVATILSNSFGFGGQNACLVFGKAPDA
jgi:3-oxoacyl-[acyl-carrier-protein] synthase II